MPKHTKAFCHTREFVLVILMALCVSPCLPAQTQVAPIRDIPDFRTLYGASYKTAFSWCLDRLPKLRESFRAWRGEEKFLLAIVFPEILRYDRYKDRAETLANEVIYVGRGSSFANFSIGPFQIKPAFAEYVEQEIKHAGSAAGIYKKLLQTSGSDEDKRKARMARVETLDGQVAYVCAFAWLIERKFGEEIKRFDTVSRLRFFATAYNAGFSRGFDDVISRQFLRFYPGPEGGTPGYVYADLAVYFYQEDVNRLMTYATGP